MDKQLTSVCNDYLQGTTAGLHNSGFFFLKLQLFAQLAQTSPAIKRNPNSDGPESAPAARFPPWRLEPNFWVEREKRDLPVALSAAPRAWAVAVLRHSRLLQSQRTQGKPSPGQGGWHWGQLERQDIPHPSDSFAKLLYGALLHKSYLTSWPEFPCGHSLHSHGQAEECLR